MLSKIFWSKYIAWLRRLLKADKPDIPFDTILDATGGPHEVPHRWYTSFSGVDIKIYFESKEGNFVCVPEIQSVSCVHEPSGRAHGEISTIIFDGDVLSSLPFKPQNMLMVAANEYGLLCYQRFISIKLGVKRWEMAIDDLIREMITEFSAEDSVSWKKIGDESSGLKDEWPCLPDQILEKLRRFK